MMSLRNGFLVGLSWLYHRVISWLYHGYIVVNVGSRKMTWHAKRSHTKINGEYVATGYHKATPIRQVKIAFFWWKGGMVSHESLYCILLYNNLILV